MTSVFQHWPFGLKQRLFQMLIFLDLIQLQYFIGKCIVVLLVRDFQCVFIDF